MKHLFLLLIMALNIQAQGQTIVGEWETYDDNTNEKKAVIQIYKRNNLYYAKIVENILGEQDAICEECEGSKKNKPIIGLVIIEKIKKNGAYFEGGTILDPESGEVYSCYLELVNNNKLKVRGYLGISIFGRTQYWIRKK